MRLAHPPLAQAMRSSLISMSGWKPTTQSSLLAWQNTSCTLHGALMAPTLTAPSARLCPTPGVSWHSPAARCSLSSHSPQELGRSPKNSGLCSVDVRRALFGLASPPCWWKESLRSLLLSLVHDILRFAPDDHPDLRREGAVVIGEADSKASCDSLCLNPYGFVSDCLECLSSSLAPHCGFLHSAIPLGFHVTGSITPRRLAPLQLSYRLCVRAMHKIRVVDMSWHSDCGIGFQHRTPFGDASLLSALPLHTLSFEFSGPPQLRLDTLLIHALPLLLLGFFRSSTNRSASIRSLSIRCLSWSALCRASSAASSASRRSCRERSRWSSTVLSASILAGALPSLAASSATLLPQRSLCESLTPYAAHG